MSLKKHTAKKIMVIRHAEKPVGPYQGVDTDGNIDPESLITKGWQRAGALTVLFDPFRGTLQSNALSIPQFLYASPPGSESKSKRPVQTITPLSVRIGLSINEGYGKSDYKKMADNAMSESGIVLIAWQHQDIPHIANHILGNHSAPQTWPGDRFDLVWVFDLDTSENGYTLTQVPQNLLAGDLNSIIS